MAYSPAKLNNIAASMGLANLWIYTDPDTAVTSLDADDYFAGAGTYGMNVGDILILSGASGGCIMGSVTTLTATTSVITAFTAVGG